MAKPAKGFKEIQIEVGMWSAANFGQQETPYLGVHHAGTIRPGVARRNSDVAGVQLHPVVALEAPGFVVALDGLAPLLGIMEEIGELAAAATASDQRDAIGDVAIYLCDYLFREGITWPTSFDHALESSTPPERGLVAFAGLLCRCHLKRHQRIRGMEDATAFREAQRHAVAGLVWHLQAVAHGEGWQLFAILNHTWTTIVSKRDWKADAEGGGGHAHEPKPDEPCEHCGPSYSWQKANPGQKHLRGCPNRETE